MRIRRIVMAGVAAGAVALALAGCTDTARGEGNGQGGEGYRGALRGTEVSGRGGVRSAVAPASERTGRDVADAGTLRTISGTLSSDDAEWYLDTGDGRFLLHLGNTSYVEQTGLVLEAGETAVVRGIVDADEVSVVSLEIDGKTFAFRSEDGRPLWAGGGRGAGRGTGRGSGQGSGRTGGLGA